MLLQSTPFADSVRTHMVEHPRFELGLALYRSLAYKATAFTIKLVLIKSHSKFRINTSGPQSVSSIILLTMRIAEKLRSRYVFSKTLFLVLGHCPPQLTLTRKAVELQFVRYYG